MSSKIRIRPGGTHVTSATAVDGTISSNDLSMGGSMNGGGVCDAKSTTNGVVPPTTIMSPRLRSRGKYHFGEIIITRYTILRGIFILLFGMIVYHNVFQAHGQFNLHFMSLSSFSMDQLFFMDTNNNKKYKCAILFWGLPRAYETLVLPSIVQNIVIPNQQYMCDYFVHFYHATGEAAGRSGSGGSIDPTAIYSLKSAIDEVNKNNHSIMDDTMQQQRVEFVYDTDEQFWNKYNPLITKIREKKKNGKYYYFPWKAVTYTHPTTLDNIIKMWNSIESSWKLMSSQNRQYDQVGMFRSDVLYVTPIDIYKNPSSNDDVVQETQKPYVVIPNFGNHPVSDRIIYGPYAAVKIWASERFSQLEQHVQWIYDNDPGWGMHSERFINYSILPLIRNRTGIDVVQHPTLCFLRARADESVWISDCEGPKEVSDPRIMAAFGGSTKQLQGFVEHIIGRPCGTITKPRRNVKSLNCSSALSVASES